jgi:hypothetical protein
VEKEAEVSSLQVRDKFIGSWAGQTYGCVSAHAEVSAGGAVVGRAGGHVESEVLEPREAAVGLGARGLAVHAQIARARWRGGGGRRARYFPAHTLSRSTTTAKPQRAHTQHNS